MSKILSLSYEKSKDKTMFSDENVRVYITNSSKSS